MNQLTVIIVEYHCINDVLEALKSAHEHLEGVSWDALVVSNSEYSAQEQERVSEALGEVRLVFNEVNSGYAGGVNKALSMIDSPFIFLLNPDGRFKDKGISKLLELMNQDDKIAIIGPMVVDESGEVQPSCRTFPKPYTFLLVRSVFRFLPYAGLEKNRYFMADYDRTYVRDVDWVSGGAMLVRRSAIEKVGMMDERYFLYMEDVDWCRSFNKASWKVKYSPDAAIIHAGQHSSINNSLMGLFSQTTRWHLQSMFKYFLKFGWK